MNIGTSEMHTEFWSESLKGRNHMRELGTGLRIILKLMLGDGMG
jgi:hypothetical protein